MTRLPFNPDLVRSRPSPASLAGIAPGDDASNGGGPGGAISVGELAERLKVALADHFPAKIRVVGEVSNFSKRTHWFFSLKDEAATIRCVCFASAARLVPCDVQDGMQVVATGRVDFYDAQGHVQLYVDRIEPVGQGALELRLRQLTAELRELGYFDEDRKRPLPAVPCKVAVVTSRSGAALQDVINTASRRWPGCRLYLVDVRVQGAAAAPEIAKAISALSRSHKRLGIDAVIVTRGGGSIEDLWAFNERVVADAIFRCRVPVVAAIGHEVDTTIAELVADLRCSTPTQAVMQLIPDRRALEHQLDQLTRRATMLILRRFEHCAHRLDAAAKHNLFRRPRRLLHEAEGQIGELERRLRAALPRRLSPASERLCAAQSRLVAALPRRIAPAKERLATLDCELRNSVPRRLREQTTRLESLVRQLESVNPHNVLQRGYSYTMTSDGRVLKRAADINAGDAIKTVLAEGSVVSRVEGEGVSPLPLQKPAPFRRKRRAEPLDGPGLFDA